jgi:hypothetical protein
MVHEPVAVVRFPADDPAEPDRDRLKEVARWQE